MKSIYYQQLLSYSVQITDFDLKALDEMKQEKLSLFRSCCAFDGKILPSLLTLCNPVPFHAGKCLHLYNMGLDCNTMEVQEQKHQIITKYAEKSTY